MRVFSRDWVLVDVERDQISQIADFLGQILDSVVAQVELLQLGKITDSGVDGDQEIITEV